MNDRIYTIKEKAMKKLEVLNHFEHAKVGSVEVYRRKEIDDIFINSQIITEQDLKKFQSTESKGNSRGE